MNPIVTDPVIIFGIIVILLCIVLVIFGLVVLRLMEKVTVLDSVVGAHLQAHVNCGDPLVSNK